MRKISCVSERWLYHDFGILTNFAKKEVSKLGKRLRESIRNNGRNNMNTNRRTNNNNTRNRRNNNNRYNRRN